MFSWNWYDGKRQKGKMSKARISGEDEQVRLKLRMREICTSVYSRFQHFYSSTFVLFLFPIVFLSVFYHHTKNPKRVCAHGAYFEGYDYFTDFSAYGKVITKKSNDKSLT
jgi:hypothetical protein